MHCPGLGVQRGKLTNLSLLKVLGRLEEVRHKDWGGEGGVERTKDPETRVSYGGGEVIHCLVPTGELPHMNGRREPLYRPLLAYQHEECIM